MTAWLLFIGSATVIVLAAHRLALDGETIAIRTGLGATFIGTMLLALATSLPELLTIVASLAAGEQALAIGNLFGSCMFNMAMLAVLDISTRQGRILSRVALGHALGASLATLAIGVATFFIFADVQISVGWVGLDSLVLLGLYLVSAWLLRGEGVLQGAAVSAAGTDPASIDPSVPSLRRASLGFAGGTLALVIASPVIVNASVSIAEMTGLSTGFIGVTLLAVVTSLPEAVTTLSAARIGVYDLAVGNLFGSNLFNIFALAVADTMYFGGRILGGVDPTMTIAALLALVMTAQAMVSTVARVERRVLGVEIDALLLLLVYAAGMVFLVQRGIVQ